MKIAVGTENKGKIEAVRAGLSKYPEFAQADIVACKCESGVSSQPIGLDQTITGAKNRAKQAFELSGGLLGFGLESGIFPVPHTKSDYMDTTACAIFDGKNYHLGLSSCFEYPPLMIKKVLEKGLEITDAALEMGFAQDREFRQASGMVGILTRGILDRQAYSEQAVHTAMIHLVNAEHY